MQVAWLAGAVFVVSLGYGALLPLLPEWLELLLAQASGADRERHVGYLSAAYAVGLLIGAPLWGQLSDRRARGPILLIGLLGYVVSMLLLLWTTAGMLTATYVLRVTAGFFVAAVVPVATATVAEHTPDDKRARRFAWLGAMTLLGFLLGPALTEAVRMGWAWAGDRVSISVSAVVIVTSAMLAIVAVLGVAKTLPRTHVAPSPGAPTPAVGLQELPLLLWLAGGAMFVLTAVEVIVVLHGGRQAAAAPNAAAMLVVCGLTMLVVNAVLFITALLAKAAAAMLAVAGLVLSMGGLTTLSLASQPAWMYLGIGLAAAGVGLLLPLVSFVASSGTKEALGVIMGALNAVLASGQMLGSFSAGWLYGVAGQLSFGWLNVVFGVLLVMLALRGRSLSDSSKRPATGRRA